MTLVITNKNKLINRSLLKAQAAAEQMFLIAMLLVPLVFITSYAYSIVEDLINVFLVNSCIDSIKHAAEQVYLQEKGSYRTIMISLPASINYSDSYIGNSNGNPGNMIQLTYKNSNAFRIVAANITGTWQQRPGTFIYLINKTNQNMVNISIKT